MRWKIYLFLPIITAGFLMPRPVNAAAMAIVDNTEGCVLTTYRDPAGIATAGYGHTGPDVRLGQSYSLDQAVAWRQADMARAAAFVEAHVAVPLNDNQFSALAEFTYNVGTGAFAGSTLLRLLNRGQYDAVPAQLARWTWAGGKVLPGLVSRRAQEVTLFTTPIATATEQPPPSLCTVKPQPPSLLERLRAWLKRRMTA